MKAITIQVSDSDYDDMVAHFAADKPGKPLVAAIAPAGPSGSFLHQDIEEARKTLGPWFGVTDGKRLLTPEGLWSLASSDARHFATIDEARDEAHKVGGQPFGPVQR